MGSSLNPSVGAAVCAIRVAAERDAAPRVYHPVEEKDTEAQCSGTGRTACWAGASAWP